MKRLFSILFLSLLTCTPNSVAHFGNVGPRTTLGAINSDAFCGSAAYASNFPETTPSNVNDGTGWNSNNQIWTTPAYYYSNAGRGLASNASFSAVDGRFTDTTQGIIRWAACKWGVDEDWAYAETAEEDGWFADCAQAHGGSGCNTGGDCNNPDSNSGGETANLSVILNGHTFQVTNGSSVFVGNSGVGAVNHNGTTCTPNKWASFGSIQNKLDTFEWYEWPMGAISHAHSQDHRWAKFRACMNGDMGGFFGNPADYTNAINAAKSNPTGISSGTNPKYFSNETNLQYMALGCIGAHFSGAWYTNTATYLNSFITILNNKSWPGGLG